MGCVIDTCVLINSEKDAGLMGKRLAGLEDAFFYISAISASELLFGIHKAVSPRQKNLRKAFVEDVLAKFPILPVDLSVARIHSELWAELSAQGRLIGSHDIWIAATCLVHGHVLVTDDKKDFSRIPGLILK